MNNDLNFDSINSDKQIVQILYTNYRGETAIRTIFPLEIWYGSTDWHPEPQWLLLLSKM